MYYKPDTPENNRFALGHRFFGILPGLVIWSTVFVREHNNICEKLAETHPDWSDEQIFQTARNAIIGKAKNYKSENDLPFAQNKLLQGYVSKNESG